MVDDRTVVRVVGMKQGAPRGGKVRAPWEAEPPEAMKWGNAHGVKGGREMNRDRNMREKESVGVAETPKQTEKSPVDLGGSRSVDISYGDSACNGRKRRNMV